MELPPWLGETVSMQMATCSHGCDVTGWAREGTGAGRRHEGEAVQETVPGQTW